MKKRTFKVISWPDAPAEPSYKYDFVCSCGREAFIPCHPATRILARGGDGMSFFYDSGYQPPNALPDQVMCRYCRKNHALRNSHVR